MRWLPTYPGQLAPTTLPQCRLVSNSRSAGLSLPPPLSLSFSLSSPPPTVTHSLSLSHKGVFGMFGESLSPPGFEPSSSGQKRCVIPTKLRRDVVCTVVLTYSALYPGLLLSLCVSRSLSSSSSLLPLLTLPMGFSCASASSYTPLMLFPVRHIAVHTAVCSAGRGGGGVRSRKGEGLSWGPGGRTSVTSATLH